MTIPTLSHGHVAQSFPHSVQVDCASKEKFESLWTDFMDVFHSSRDIKFIQKIALVWSSVRCECIEREGRKQHMMTWELEEF